MARPWYPRYPDDYARKTAHLTFAEHGAYGLLMDQYYRTGEPLPAEPEALFRVCRGAGKAELRALVSVLTQFFERRDARLHNVRADEEIAWAVELSEKRSCARKRRTIDPTIVDHLTTQLQPQPQERDTEPSLTFVGSAKAEPKKGTRWNPSRIVEKDWISDGYCAREKEGLPKIDLEFEAREFVAYFTGADCKKPVKKDWHAAWLRWCRLAEGKRYGIPGSNGRNENSSRFERLAAIRQQALADERAAQILED